MYICIHPKPRIPKIRTKMDKTLEDMAWELAELGEEMKNFNLQMLIGQQTG